MFNRKDVWIWMGVGAALLVAMGLKGWLVFSGKLPFNSDEAVVALMGRHILGGETPTFFYGQAYMGSLDAWLVAFGFWFFGEHVWVVRLVQMSLYLGVLVSTYRLGEVAFGSKQVGLGAVWLLAIPNVIVSLYTTVSLGGYGEGLLIGNLILISGIRNINDLTAKRFVKAERWLVWGFLAGLGLWVFGITLIYSLGVGIFLVLKLAEKGRGFRNWVKAERNWNPLDLVIIGGLVGASPWWIFAVKHGLKALLGEMLGSAVAVESGSWLVRVGQHLWRLVLFGGTAAFGLRPSWEIRWLAKPLLPIALVFWMGVMVYIVHQFRNRKWEGAGAKILVSTMGILAAGFVFTSFGVDPSGRYFVPLAIPLSLFAADMVHWLSGQYGRWAWGLIPLILIFNGWGNLECALRNPPGLTTQFAPNTQVDQRYMGELIEFLEMNGETRGYTNYWVAYPLAFQSEEELIFIPRLPYHQDFRYTSRDDRYEPYRVAVAEAERVAYITTLHPALDGVLRVEFERLGVGWKEKQIGDFQVFFDLTRVVRPEEMGLGERGQ